MRLGISVAQGIALGLDVPVLPISSLAALAADVMDVDPTLTVLATIDARMGEVYAGRYRWTPPRWQVLQQPALLTLPALHARWAQQPPLCVAGTALPAFGDALRCGAALRADGRFDRAAALARVAQQRWRDAGGVDAAAALPLYLRDKVALTTAERDALRAAAR